MLDKLRRDHRRLEKQITPDRVFNFVVTGFHVIDWIKNDPTTSAATKKAVRAMYRRRCISICRDLANASKHFTLDEDYQNQVVAKTSVLSGYGDGQYGQGTYGTGTRSVVIVLTDGSRLDVLDWAKEVVQTWETFFVQRGL
jgi:hypothetical protein